MPSAPLKGVDPEAQKAKVESILVTKTLVSTMSNRDMTHSQIKSYQTILWPKNPVWYKGLGNFKKLIRDPYMKHVAEFEKYFIRENPPETTNKKKAKKPPKAKSREQLESDFKSFVENCSKQTRAYNDHLKDPERRLKKGEYKKTKDRKEDQEKVAFLNQKIEKIATLKTNLEQLKFKVLDSKAAYKEIEDSLLILGKDETNLKPGQRENALKAISKDLGSLMNFDTRNFQKFMTSGIDPDTLTDILNAFDTTASEKVVKATVMSLIDDKEYLNRLAITSIVKEAEKASERTAFFRGNSVTSKIAKHIFLNDPECNTFVHKTCQPSLDELKMLKAPYEVDPPKLKADSGDPQEILKQNIAMLKKAASDALARVTKSMPPDQVCLLAYTVAESFMNKFSDATPKEFYQKIGGLVFLRYICPHFTGNVWQKPNEQGRMAVPAEWLSGQRTAILITKCLQNLSNNNTFSVKEPYMGPLNIWITTNQKTMNDFLDQVVKKGKILASKGGAKAFAPFTGTPIHPSPTAKLTLKSESEIDLGKSHGKFKMGTADGTGLNCLIDSVGNALGISTTEKKREEIRAMLIKLKLAKKNEFLYNDQKVLSAILQGLGKSPGFANIFFISNGSSVVDNLTYNVGASKTIYIHNDRNVHFSPLVKQKATP